MEFNVDVDLLACTIGFVFSLPIANEVSLAWRKSGLFTLDFEVGESAAPAPE